MPVRTKRLGLGISVAQTYVPLYTCPAGETAIIKCVTFWVPNGPQGACNVALTPSGGSRAPLFRRVVDAANTTVVETWVVLHPGDVLEFWSDQSGATTTVSGTELEGVAD